MTKKQNQNDMNTKYKNSQTMAEIIGRPLKLGEGEVLPPRPCWIRNRASIFKLPPHAIDESHASAFSH